MHNTARTVSRKVRNTAHSVVKHTRNFVNNHRRAIEITRNVVAIASIALIAIPLVAPVAIPAMAIAALGIVEVGLDLAVGDNTSAAVGLLCLFPMGKGFKYVTEIGGDAVKGGSKAKNLYKVASDSEQLLLDKSKIFKELDKLNINKISHIIEGSKGSNHQWEKLVPDKNWNDIKNIIGEVIETGGDDVYKNGTSKVKLINGELVQVTYRKLQNGIIKIGDAWIK
ncbi:polymorphic toxin type 35 domain-containing protein [Clostridium sporogenes]|uniref:polymorphic toxin type 35 domain-containing protein n=1 Tax=Clostridium sporogenes TaxID=1509 RepID=UPI002238175C|nr:polymorphic toxin type 35 domain-containing protein [Clostridium sporogenes]MCW6111104.1 hypothetical protein [Clostridium sporogenes]